MTTTTESLPLLLREKEVCDLVGKRHTQLREDVNKGTFPAPVSIGARAIAWKRADILGWIDARPYIRSTTPPAALGKA